MTALVWTLWDAVNALQWLIDHWWALLIGIGIMVAFWFWERESQ